MEAAQAVCGAGVAETYAVFALHRAGGPDVPLKWRAIECIGAPGMVFDHVEMVLPCPCPRAAGAPGDVPAYTCPCAPAGRGCWMGVHHLSITANMQFGPFFVADRPYMGTDSWEFLKVPLTHDELRCITAPLARNGSFLDMTRGPTEEEKRANARHYNSKAFWLSYADMSFMWNGLVVTGIEFSPEVREMQDRLASAKKFACSEMVSTAIMCVERLNQAHVEACGLGAGCAKDPYCTRPDDVVAAAIRLKYATWITHAELLGLMRLDRAQCKRKGGKKPEADESARVAGAVESGRAEDDAAASLWWQE